MGITMIKSVQNNKIVNLALLFIRQAYISMIYSCNRIMQTSILKEIYKSSICGTTMSPSRQRQQSADAAIGFWDKGDLIEATQ